MSQYYYRVFGEEYGPISLELLQSDIASGQLSSDHEIRCSEETRWIRVADFIAQGDTHHSSATVPAVGIHTWDGGHDDIEAVQDVVGNEPAALLVDAAKPVDQWFCRESPIGPGPHTLDDLRRFVRSGELVAEDEVSHNSQGPWTTVSSIEYLVAEMHFPLVETNSPSSSADSGLPKNAEISASNAMVASSSLDIETDAGLKNTGSKMSEEQTGLDAVGTKTQWYARMGKIERGPMEFEKLIDLASAGHIVPSDRVRRDGESDWTIARIVPGLFSSQSSSSQSLSPTPLTTARPSLIPLFQFAHTKNTSETTRSQPTVTASVQNTILSPLPSASPELTYSLAPVHSLPIEAKQSASHSELRTQSHHPSIEVAHETPQVQPEASSSVDQRFSDRPIRRPTPLVNVESKHKLRRGQFQEQQLFDRRNVVFFAGLGAVALLYFGWTQIPVGVGRFEEPCKELEAIYQILDEKWSQRPTLEFWKITKKEVVYRIESVKRKVKNLNSRYPIRNNLIDACDCMAWSAKAESNDEVTLFMGRARYLLDRSEKDIQMASLPAVPGGEPQPEREN